MEHTMINVSAGKICEAMITWSNTNTKLMTMENDLRAQGALVLARVQKQAVETAIQAANNQQSATQKQALGNLISGFIGAGALAAMGGAAFKSFNSEDIDKQLSDANKLQADLKDAEASASPAAKDAEASASPAAANTQQATTTTPEGERQIDLWKGNATKNPNFRNYDPTDSHTKNAITALNAGRTEDLALVRKNLTARIEELKNEQNSYNITQRNTLSQVLNQCTSAAKDTVTGGTGYQSAQFQNDADKQRAYNDLLKGLEGSFTAYINNQQSAAQANQQASLQNAANAIVQVATAA